MKTRPFPGLVLVAAVVLSGCALPTFNRPAEVASAGSPRTWFDAPVPNTVFLPPTPCGPIVGHGASPNGIAAFELSINGVPSSIPSPDPQGSLVTLRQECEITQPGEYLLQLRAQDNAGKWSGYAETNFTIIAEGGTPTPTPAPAGPTITRVSMSTQEAYYPSGSDCSPTTLTIQAVITAPSGVASAVIRYRILGPEEKEVMMTTSGADLYQGTIDVGAEAQAVAPLNPGTWLSSRILARDMAGNVATWPGKPHGWIPILVYPCGRTPTPTPTPTPPPQASIELVSISTDRVSYGCASQPKEVTIVVRATDPAGITAVVLFYRLRNKDSGETTDYFSQAMMPQGGDLYSLVVNPAEDIMNPVDFRLFGDSWLQYQAVIQNAQGDTSTRTTTLSDITVALQC